MRLGSVPRAARHRGFTVLELVVALTLGLAVAHAGLATLARMHAARDRLALRTDALVAQRIARHVLRRELRHGRPVLDWQVEGDSLRLRAFRGVGLVCGLDSANATVEVSYSGDRAPDPSKDSVLLVDAVGHVEVRALRGTMAAGAGCADWGTSARWVLDRAPNGDVVVAKLFELGSYSVSGALRYRRGAGGRQPLTPDVWTVTSGWLSSASHVGLQLRPRAPGAGLPWQAFLAWSTPE